MSDSIEEQIAEFRKRFDHVKLALTAYQNGAYGQSSDFAWNHLENYLRSALNAVREATIKEERKLSRRV